MRNIGFPTLSLALILGACSSAAPGPSALPSSPTVEGGDWDWLFDDPPDPINVEVELDMGRGVEAMVTPDGGKLEATGADGTHYILDLPPGSVVMDTLVRMTPVAEVSGLPLNQSVTSWAVQLEPDGVQILANATLTIRFATPPPIIEQIPIQYQGDGQGFSLAAPVVNAAVDTGVDDDGIQVAIFHFSGYGVARGYLSELEPVRKRLGGAVEDEMIADFAAYLAVERQRQMLGTADEDYPTISPAQLESLRSRYIEEILQPRMEAAKGSCAAGRLALENIVTWNRIIQLLGLAGDEFNVSNLPIPVPEGFAQMVTRTCMQEEYEMCRDQHVIHRMVPQVLDLKRQMEILGVDEPIDPAILELVKKCMTFELQFDSAGTSTDPPDRQIPIGSRASITVTSTVSIELNLDNIYRPYLFGDGVLIVSKFEREWLTSDRGCYFTGAEGADGQITIPRLGLIAGEWENGDYPRYVGVEMLHYETGLEGRSTEYCYYYEVGGGTRTSEWGEIYLLAFEELHREEVIVDPPGYRAIEWEMGPGEPLFGKTWGFAGSLVARKTWELSGSDESGDVHEETGSFTLFHRPK